MTQSQFQNALTIYRKAIEQGPDDATRALILGMLDRWADHPQANDAWESLCKASEANSNPMPDPGFFIGSVARTRLDLERLNNRVIEKSPAVQRRWEHQANRAWKSGDVLTAAAKRLASQGLEQDKRHLLGREQKTAPRKRFMRMWADTFQHNCGTPLDGVVATLTEVAFDEQTSIDAVRGSRRSTKRDTRKRK
jgi:hypothetical protein